MGAAAGAAEVVLLSMKLDTPEIRLPNFWVIPLFDFCWSDKTDVGAADAFEVVSVAAAANVSVAAIDFLNAGDPKPIVEVEAIVGGADFATDFDASRQLCSIRRTGVGDVCGAEASIVEDDTLSFCSSLPKMT